MEHSNDAKDTIERHFSIPQWYVGSVAPNNAQRSSMGRKKKETIHKKKKYEIIECCCILVLYLEALYTTRSEAV